MMLTTTTPAAQQIDEAFQELMREAEKIKCSERIADDSAAVANASEAPSCPPVWDELLCWGRAPAGRLLEQRCPSYLFGFNPQEFASKQCTAEGQWFVRDGESPWTNFSRCFSARESTVVYSVRHFNDSFITPHLSALKTISKLGYSISLISLLVAFVILISFKKLRCPRNVLHMHLFASFVLRAFMTLLKDSLFVAGLGTSGDFLEQREGSYDYFRQTQGNWECKMIISIWQYCIKANYSWILMEGLYLHNLIFQALITDSSSIMWYIVLGWGLPSIFVIPWTICRAKLEDTLCWTTNDDKFVFLLIRGPTMASILVNFVLFIRIVAVLLRKLQSSVCEETQTYRRWAKSTLVLIPLFGVHYTLFFGLQFGTNSAVEIVWLYCDQLFTSFNGYGVALLYCFLNGEVRAEVARKWRSFSLGEALERSIFSGGRLARGRRPRGSCYSSASCTLDSVVHSGRAEKKRPHVALKAPRAKVKGTFGKHGRRPSSERALERNAVELERLPSSNDV